MNPSDYSSIEWNVKTRIDAYWRSTNAGYGQNAQAVLAQDDTWTAEILWQDISATAHNSITVEQNKTKDGVVLKMQDTDMRGNVVVAVKRSGVILWSWHIWITDYNPDAIAEANGTKTTTNSKFTSSDSTGELHRYESDMWTTGELAGKYIMDRNVGALDTAYAYTSNGGRGNLYYQFGRKDPFPAGTNAAGTSSGTVSAAWDSSGSTWTITGTDYFNSSTTGVSMATSIQNPMVHYYRSSTYIDSWCSDSVGYDTTSCWQDSQVAKASGGKSIFDPSPAGWKLPTVTANTSAGSPWFGASSSTLSSSVPTYFTNASYPACGLRTYSTAAMYGVGSYGYYWSATPYSTTNGYYFYFNSGYVNPANSVNRSYGYSVRAVQE